MLSSGAWGTDFGYGYGIVHYVAVHHVTSGALPQQPYVVQMTICGLNVQPTRLAFESKADSTNGRGRDNLKFQITRCIWCSDMSSPKGRNGETIRTIGGGYRFSGLYESTSAPMTYTWHAVLTSGLSVGGEVASLREWCGWKCL